MAYWYSGGRPLELLWLVGGDRSDDGSFAYVNYVDAVQQRSIKRDEVRFCVATRARPDPPPEGVAALPEHAGRKARQGRKGRKGPQGAQGLQGPAGQAVAFARVMSDGTLMPTDPPRLRGSAQERCARKHLA
jgi:hypothetical protein